MFNIECCLVPSWIETDPGFIPFRSKLEQVEF